jgi:Carboxypeptidase regulatory-like domain/TonB dependent receptor
MHAMCVRAGVLVALLAIASTAALAQSGLVELRGTVVDESGGALPGATVTATQAETGAVRTSVTSETGGYIMPALPVGTYQVRVELAGFSTAVREDMRFQVGESLVVNFSMKLGTVEETITVSGEAPLVDTTRSDISGRVDAKQVESLPLNGRNWLDLVALVPGARGNPGQIQAGASGGDMAKYNVDGVDVSNQCCVDGSNQGYSQENIAEFQVITNRFDAEYGRVGGAVINAITKSGANRTQATTFGYFRSDKFGDAPNFFTGEVSPFGQDQLGVNAGGPVIRDKLFYFGSFEYQQQSLTTRPNTRIPEFDVDVSQDRKRYYTTARLDQQLGGKQRLFLRGSAFNWHQSNNGVGGRTTVSGGIFRPSANYDMSLGHTWVINSRAVHEIRTGFSHIDNWLQPNSSQPRLNFPSAVLGSPTNAPQVWKEMNVQVNQSLSYFVPSWKGEHNLKGGFQFFRPKWWGSFPAGPPHGAQYTFSRDPANFNDPSTYPQASAYSVTLGDPSFNVGSPVYAGFIQDNWTLTRKLTVNLGLRYDFETGVANTEYPNPLLDGPRQADKNNFAPRFGFAYDLRGDGRTVIRGGGGRYFDRVLLNIATNERRLILGQFVSALVLNPNFNDPLQGKTFEDFKSLPSNFIVMAQDYQAPQNDQWTIGVAQQLWSSFAVQADYVRTRASNEPISPIKNFFQDPATGLPRDPTIFGRPNPQYTNITYYENGASSHYDGLQIGVNGRNRRISVQASYTLSVAKDDHNGNRFTTPNNPFNLADEWAYSQYDQRHRLATNALVTLPWDVQVSAIYFVGSPRTIPVNTNLDPFRLGYTGRWLDATGRTLPRNSERTTSDYKLDLRLSKKVQVGRVAFQGLADVFNVFNTRNNDRATYGTNVFSTTYLQPSSSTSLFYQPRQVQLGFRITY